MTELFQDTLSRQEQRVLKIMEVLFERLGEYATFLKKTPAISGGVVQNHERVQQYIAAFNAGQSIRVPTTLTLGRDIFPHGDHPERYVTPEALFRQRRIVFGCVDVVFMHNKMANEWTLKTEYTSDFPLISILTGTHIEGHPIDHLTFTWGHKAQLISN